MWLILFLLLFPAGLYAQVIDPVVTGDGEVKTLPVGKTEVAEIQPKPQDTSVIIAIDRTNFTDPKQIVVFGLEGTTDGSNWFNLCRAITQGGEIKNTPLSSVSCSLRSGIKTKGFITVTDKSLDAGVLLLTK